MKSNVKVTVKMNDKMILGLKKAQRDAAQLTIEATKREIEKSEVVPRDSGKLEESLQIKTGLLDKGKVTVSYNTPYARRLYFHPEYNFSHDENANAKGEWLEDYLNGGSKANYMMDTYIKIYRRLTGV